MNMKLYLVICLSVISLQSLAEVKSFSHKLIKQDLGIVWAMDFIEPETMVFTQRSGEAGLLNTSSGKVIWLQGLPEVHAVGQGGLLDVKAAPDFQQSAWLYFTYAQSDLLKARTVLARAKLRGTQLVDWQELLITESASFSNIHFGSRLAFDDKGHVFFTVGDRGNRANAQDLQSHAGKVLRLNLDGSVPTDNPFVNHPTALPEIWSYGHRNPQGLVYDFETQRLWEMEHGPGGGDEINLIKKGANYGWPIVSQGREYISNRPVGVKHQYGMLEPIKVYIPSIAPSDLVIWQGDLFAGALALRHLNQVILQRGKAINEHRYFESLNQRVRSLTLDSRSRLYFATDKGNIYQLEVKET